MESDCDLNFCDTEFFCGVHSKLCTLWCNHCEVMICSECIDDQHDAHPIRKLTKHLVEKIESSFAKPLYDVVAQCRETLRNVIESKFSELKKLKSSVVAIENELSIAQKQENLFDEYCKLVQGEVAERKWKDASLLLSLSKIDSPNKGFLYFLNSLGISVEELVNPSQSTQTEVTQVSVQCSTSTVVTSHCFTQTESYNSTIFTQTEVCNNDMSCQTADFGINSSLSPGLGSSSGPVNIESSSRLAFAGTEVSTVQSWGSYSNRSSPPSLVEGHRSKLRGSDLKINTHDSCTLSVTETEVSTGGISITKFVGGLADCGCLVRHKPELPLNYPISLIGLLRVNQRDPLRIGNSNDLIICPFQFWISADVRNHKFRHNDKILRLEINCCHVYDDDERLPAMTFQYGLTLNNNLKNEPDKEKEGTWIFPKYKQLFWYSVPCSELLNPQKGWIDRDSDIVVTVELKLR